MNDVDRIARLIERRLPLRILQLVEDDEPERSPLQKLWDTATRHETWKACMAKAVGEVSPPGWEGTVKAMKGHPDITNPWALAWWMDGQGMSSHKQSEKEGGPGSGRHKGGGSQIIARGETPKGGWAGDKRLTRPSNRPTSPRRDRFDRPSDTPKGGWAGARRLTR